MARAGKIVMLASVPLFLEYEATCTLPEHTRAAGLSYKDCLDFLDALAAIVEPVECRFLWRPQLNDPADEMVLEAAVNGQARCLVSFNHRHFGAAPARFGVELLLPSEALEKLR
jgi:predicted nucleic acid-binding protein